VARPPRTARPRLFQRTLPPFPFRCLAAHFPWVRSARTRLPCTCACEAFPSQLTPHPASRAVPGRRALRALAHPLPLSSIHSLSPIRSPSASSSRRPRVQSDAQR
ncbi:hypothetical protein EV363DRAFT_1226666, partial [Boletus edulis]